MSDPFLSYGRAATLGSDAVLSALHASTRGLSIAEVSARRARIGSNELAASTHGWPRTLGRQFASPFAWLLMGASAISFFTGDRVEATMIVLFILINAALGFFQEERAQRATQALRSFWRASARVIRDGAEQEIHAADLVPGDIVRLQTGDRLPADMRFLQGHGVQIDESILTGETAPVPKDARRMIAAPTAFYQASCIGFSGTMMVGGEGEAVVIATGRKSAAGSIETMAEALQPASAFEREISRFASFTLRLVAVTLVFVFVLNLGLKGLGRFQELLIFVVALTVGVIPEALPVVTTMALSSGALRMAKKGVVVKRLSAINDLGSMDILCTDKTGTMTQNVLRVAGIRARDEAKCLRAAVLGSERMGRRAAGNSFDDALWSRAPAALREEAERASMLGFVPFDPARRRNAALVKTADGKQMLVVRGAPEDVAPLCANAPNKASLAAALKEEGREGNRLLAIAIRPHAHDTDIKSQEYGLTWLGLIAFRDPLKEDAFAAVARAKRLGVQIKILTGDAADVAGAVAHRLKLVEDPSEVMTGEAFGALSPAEQHKVVERMHVFARLDPAQKFAILELLKEKHAVGFLGEGFNDAPGLKVAHAAIAVSGASDAAKDVADVILLRKSLTVICDGIEEGRRTAANVTAYLRITLASNFGNFYSVAVASLFIEFLPMLPAQILLVNLLTDMPMIAISGDHPDLAYVRKPHHSEAKDIVQTATILGIVSSLFDFAAFGLFRSLGEGGLQTMWFSVSMMTELVLIYSLRTRGPFWKARRPGTALLWLTVFATGIAVALPFTPAGRALFGFVAVPRMVLWQGAGLVAGYFAVTECVKLRFYRQPQAKPSDSGGFHAS